MKRVDNNSKFYDFRELYPTFCFDRYDVEYGSDRVEVVFSFNIADKYCFRPSFRISNVNCEKVDRGLMDILAFHIGMIELVSYWKITCSPRIIIKPKHLPKEALEWWRRLYFNGLGEFFYLNGIEIAEHDMVEIESIGDELLPCFDANLGDGYLVPIGGGKDSVVTLSLLKDAGMDVMPLIMNPRGATIECIRVAGYELSEALVIERRLDPLMISMNAEGFLNGHTPFSALLAFNTLAAAVVTGRGNIALSNESSAEEATVKDTHINHQYSKSYEFEAEFRWYVDKYISKGFNYFSFLRPLNELKIASIFARYAEFFPVFKSCNVGSKSDIWCCNCPKCLFAYSILAPFVQKHELIKIFGENLFEKESLKGYMDELTGVAEVKPFECVGTIDEVKAALYKTIANYGDEKLPLLLEHFKNGKAWNVESERDWDRLMGEFNERNFLTKELIELLK